MALQQSVGDFLTATGIVLEASTFGLAGARSEIAKVNTLSWTWPTGMDATNNPSIRWGHLTLQRSTTASNRPNLAVAYTGALNQLPAPDAAWTNVYQLNKAQYVALNPANTLTDAWSSSAPVCYRLIINFAYGEDPVIINSAEMCWNTRLIVPSQPFSACCLPNGQSCTTVDKICQPRLSWSAPDTSWWP